MDCQTHKSLTKTGECSLRNFRPYVPEILDRKNFDVRVRNHSSVKSEMNNVSTLVFRNPLHLLQPNTTIFLRILLPENRTPSDSIFLHFFIKVCDTDTAITSLFCTTVLKYFKNL